MSGLVTMRQADGAVGGEGEGSSWQTAACRKVGDLLALLGNRQNMQKVDWRKTSWGQMVV